MVQSRTTITGVALGMVLICAARSQDATRLPAFEVISVKSSAMQNAGVGIGLFTYPGGRVRANVCPLDYFISEAFDIQIFQIAGAPRWVHDDRWDIEAKPPANSQSSKSNPNNLKLPPNQEQRLMMQALLADRFHLRCHLETREVSAYLLVRTNKPLKLEPAKDPDEYPWVGSVAGAAINGDGLKGTNATMALMAARLSSRMEHPVIDRTGLQGSFDFEFALDKGDIATDLVSSIMASLEGLGLKLETGRGPQQTLVIDAVEKPGAN